MHTTTGRHLPGAAAFAVAAALALGGCAGEPAASPPTTAPATAEPSATVEPTATTTPEAPSVSAATEIWFMVDTRAGLRLVREAQDVTGPDVVHAAVAAMIAGPQDPDYTTPWLAGTQVLGVGEGPDGAVVVDLSADARTANTGSAGAALMIQQLVHTVTDALDDPAALVSLTIEGEPPGDLWGAVTWTEPVGRADPLDVRVLVQIDEPREGGTSGATLTVTGEAAAFEANVPWRVLDATGAEVAAGFTMTSEGMTFAPYSFTVDLPPGTYTVVVQEDDPSDGEAGAPMSDTRTVTIA